MRTGINISTGSTGQAGRQIPIAIAACQAQQSTAARSSSLQGQEQTSFNLDEFVHSWAEVWEAVACLPNFRRDLEGRVFIDILNEPDSQWQGWQPKQGKAGEATRLH